MEGNVFDLCIVGAGFFGSAAARHASANPSIKVCLIGLDEPKENEMHLRDIYSSHYDEGRIVKILSYSPAYQILSRQSLKQMKHLERLSGTKFHNPVGFIHVGKKGNRLMKYIEDASTTVGTSFLQLSDDNFNRKMYPFLKLKEDEYGLLEKAGAGITNARRMIAAEKMVARSQGCRIVTDQVKQVSPLTGNYHEVETTKFGIIKAKRVLFTTGAYANVNNFKILPQLELYVYRELATLVKVSDTEAQRLRTMPGIIYKRDEDDPGSYILPPVFYPDGSHYLKIGGMMYDSGKGLQTLPEIKKWFFVKEKSGEKEKMSKLLFEALPGLKSEGLYPKLCVTCETPSGFPYVDQITPTITIAVAGNGWGASTAEEIGRIAASLSLTGMWDSEVPKSLFELVPKENPILSKI